MDGAVNNPQHYQPLSHALNPPFATARPRSPYSAPAYDGQQHHHHQPSSVGQSHHGVEQDESDDPSGRPEEEEEEEEEEEVEGAVVHHPTATTTTTTTANEADTQTSAPHPSPSNAVPPRRKPGRPKGSKNKKPRFDLSGSPPKIPPFPATPPFYGYAQPPPGSVPMQAHPPVHPVTVPPPNPFPADSNNSQFYDFQWRVLTLCSEFYNAADELIRSAPPHIVSQCFSLPSGHIDPISILHDARRACDQLMANPSQAVLKPPTTNAPTYTTSATPPKPVVTAPPTQTPAAVITNPGSFVMSLSAPSASGSPAPAVPAPAYSTTFPPPGRYPTTSYYAYATTTHTAAPGAHPYSAQQQVMKPVNLSTPASSGNQGAWSEEETEKLRKLAEESKTQGTGSEPGEIDWDWVCSAWGPGRTRHQILIKATNVGMKESSTRGVKRRRDTDQHTPSNADHANHNTNDSPSVGTATTQQVLNAVGAAVAATSTTATPDRPASTALSSQAASPIVAHQQAPTPVPVAPPQPPGGGTVMQWPMPHVAANTPSPVISSATTRSVFYQDGRNSRK